MIYHQSEPNCENVIIYFNKNILIKNYLLTFDLCISNYTINHVNVTKIVVQECSLLRST